MDTRLCGIDSSTSNTGLSLFVNGKLVGYKLISLDKKDTTQWDRLNPMLKQIGEVLSEWKPNIIYQEQSWKGRNIDTLKCLTNIMGGVRFWALMNNCEYYVLLPSQWRARLGLNKYEAERPELKNAAMQFVKDKYDIDVPTDDISDCICLGLAGLSFYGFDEEKENDC